MNKNNFMIELMFGQDSYSSQKHLRAIKKKHILENQEINLIVIQGKQLSDIFEIKEEILSPPFLGDKKMIVIENFLSENKKTTLKNEYLQYIQNHNIADSKEVHIIHYENTKDIDKRQSLYKYFQKGKCIQEFEIPQAEKIAPWMKEYIQQHDCDIDNETIQFLMQRFATLEFWSLEHAMEKLVLFAHFQNEKNITPHMVETCIPQEALAKIFDMTDAIAYKNKSQALKELKKLLEQGENAFVILGTLAYQIRTLLTIKLLQEKNMTHQDIIRVSKLHPFVVNKNASQTKKFATSDLIQLLQYICEGEYNLKSRETDEQLLLVELIDTCTKN